MIDLLGIKAHQATGVVTPHLAAQPVQSDPQRIKALARSYLAQKRRVAA